MDDAERIQGVEQAARVLPLRLRSGVMSLPEDRRSPDRGAAAAGGDGPWRQCCRRGSAPWAGAGDPDRSWSSCWNWPAGPLVHTVADQLRRGYLTVEGGHRVGLCGTAALVRTGQLREPSGRLSSAAVAGGAAGPWGRPGAAAGQAAPAGGNLGRVP
ncbi:MAG: hypothetical protein ACLUJG_08310 [Lawsonibacter sp.]